MKRKNEFKFIYLFLLAIVLFNIQTIAFSAMTTTMNLKGIGYARIETNVRINDLRINNLNNSIINYYEFNKHNITTGITLNSNSSNVVFSIDIGNYTSTNIGIYSIDGLPTGLTYSISDYTVGEAPLINGIGNKTINLTISGNSGSYNLSLNFDFQTLFNISYTGFSNSDYPKFAFKDKKLTINFNENVGKCNVKMGGSVYNDYTLNNNTLIINNVTGDIVIEKENTKKATLVDGFVNVIGSEVCMDNECFYVISNNDTTVSLLAKYNLYVGGYYNNSTSVWTAYGSEATGIQDASMLGNDSSNTIYKGTTPYSSSSQKGTNYNTFVGSIAEKYVNNYKNYLMSNGYNIKNARLIKNDEVFNNVVKCELPSSSNNYSGNCNKSPYPWIYSSSYWTMGVNGDTHIWPIYKSGALSATNYDTGKKSFGIRPVIELETEDISYNTTSGNVKPVASGSLDTIGTVVTIDTEKFYVIGSDSENVKLLSKYNLYVGNSYNTSTGKLTAYAATATGIQESTMLGADYSSTTYNGVTPFAAANASGTYSSTYEGSIAEKYVDNYVKILESKGVPIVESRLLTQGEFTTTTFKCQIPSSSNNYTGNCYSSPYSWIYSTSYWTMPSGNSHIWGIRTSGGLSGTDPTEADDLGVRPVIVISKSLF